MNKLKKLFNSYYFNFGLIALATIMVLYFTLRDNFEQIIEVISQVNVWWLIITILLTILVQLFIGAILQILANISNPSYSLIDGFINALTATFFHGITPSSSGGQIAQIYVYRKQGVKISDSLSILLMDFILYQSTLVGLSAVFLIIKFDYISTNYNAIYWLVLLAFLVDSFFVVALFLLSSYPKIYTWVSHQGLNILSKIRIIKDRESASVKLDESLSSFQNAWNEIRKQQGVMFKVVILNILRLTTYYAIPFFVFLALNANLSFSNFFDILLLTSFVSVINHLVPIPGASGTTEATFLIFMIPIVGEVYAVGGAIIWRFITFHILMVFSAIIFAIFKKFHSRSEVSK